MIARRPLLLGAAGASLLAGRALAQTAADFAGDWHGALDLGSQRLRLRLNVAPGPVVTIFSVDQGGAPIPGVDARIEGDQLSVRFPVINASYEGRLANGRIEGRFTQRGTLPLAFARAEAAPAAAPEALTQARLAALRSESGAPALAAAGANRDGRRVAFVDGVRALGEEAPATNADVWHLGSITKSMTATLVASCIEAGLVSWSDSVGALLGAAAPEMRAEYRDVTFRHLLCHRAGLQPNIETAQLLAFPRESLDARHDRVAYARLALAQAPQGPKETTFAYSNSGYVLAGAMLEAKLGAPWETLIAERLFAPLGMASAGQGAPGRAGALEQPVGHALGESGGLEAFPPGSPATDNPAVLGPAGRVHASFDDVLKYLAAHRDRAGLLRRESWDALHTPPFGGPYAMGWARRGDAFWHNGSNTLWYAEVMFDATRGVASVAAANDGRAGEMGRPVGAALIGAAQAVS